MKKIISIVIASACVLALFAGCSAKAPEAAAEDGNYRLRLLCYSDRVKLKRKVM